MLVHRCRVLLELFTCFALTLVLFFLLMLVPTANAIFPPIPRSQAVQPTYSASFSDPQSMLHYLTSYTSTTFADDSQPDTVLYNSSVSKHAMFTRLWLFYIPDSTVRLDAVVALKKDSVIVAGTSQSVQDATTIHRLFIATVVQDTSNMKMAINSNFTSKPAAFVKVARVVVVKKLVFVCGRRLPLEQSEAKNGAFLLAFDSKLQTNISLLSQQGDVRNSCADIVTAEDEKYIFIAQTRYTESTHYGIVSARPVNDLDSAPLWETVLDSSSIDDDMKSGNRNATDVAILAFFEDRLSLYIVARLHDRVTKSGAYTAIFKLSSRTGVVLWVLQKLAIGKHRGTELVGSLGLVVAQDNYVYSVLRLRNGTGEVWPPLEQPQKNSMYASFVARASVWGKFDVMHDISLPLWVSTDVRGPAAGVAFSGLQGVVQSLGGGAAPVTKQIGESDPGTQQRQVPYSNMTKDTAAHIPTLMNLPLGPATNDAKTSATPFGSVGSQFLRMTFNLKAKGNHDQRLLDIVVDVVAEMMHIWPTQLTRDTTSKLEDMKPTKRIKEISRKYALLVRGADLTDLESKVRGLIESITKRDEQGWSMLEKRMKMKEAGSLQLGDLVVRSRGRTKAPDSGGKRRSAADVAQDLVKNTTITGVTIAALLVALVALAVGCAKLRRMRKNEPDSRASVVSDGPMENLSERFQDPLDSEVEGDLSLAPADLVV